VREELIQLGTQSFSTRSIDSLLPNFQHMSWRSGSDHAHPNRNIKLTGIFSHLLPGETKIAQKT